MSWSIAQVARMSGTTSRTLRHYDAEGLLPPAYVGSNGYRYYERDQLLRLQEILVLRELGLGLETIAGVLDDTAGPAARIAALRRHRGLLAREQERLGRLLATVDRTIADLTAGMAGGPAADRMGGAELVEHVEHPERWFEGFDPERQQAYEAEARQRWGDESVDTAKAAMATWTREDVQAVEAGMAEAHEAVAALMTQRVAPDDARTLDAVDLHYRWVSRFWVPDADAYAGLGRMYVDDERFTETIDRTAPGLAAYLSEAMEAYAIARLA